MRLDFQSVSVVVLATILAWTDTPSSVLNSLFLSDDIINRVRRTPNSNGVTVDIDTSDPCNTIINIGWKLTINPSADLPEDDEDICPNCAIDQDEYGDNCSWVTTSTRIPYATTISGTVSTITPEPTQTVVLTCPTDETGLPLCDCVSDDYWLLPDCPGNDVYQTVTATVTPAAQCTPPPNYFQWSNNGGDGGGGGGGGSGGGGSGSSGVSRTATATKTTSPTPDNGGVTTYENAASRAVVPGLIVVALPLLVAFLNL